MIGLPLAGSASLRQKTIGRAGAPAGPGASQRHAPRTPYHANVSCRAVSTDEAVSASRVATRRTSLA